MCWPTYKPPSTHPAVDPLCVHVCVCVGGGGEMKQSTVYTVSVSCSIVPRSPHDPLLIHELELDIVKVARPGDEAK